MPLDDYIMSNPGRFDTEEPLAGHFDRFDEKLSRLPSSRTIKGWNMVMKIAAVIILGLVLAYGAFRESRFVSRSLNYMLSSENFPELKEAEQYYNFQMNAYYSKIENLRFENDIAQKQQILDELSFMDRQVMSLKHDLLQNPENERVVHAIINHYQVKLEFMDMIITRTEESNQTIL